MAEKKRKKVDPTKVSFDPLEMQVSEIDPKWNAEKLMAQDGLFLLGPVCKKLGVEIAMVRKKYKERLAEGGDPWDEMGITKVLSVWMVRMVRFAPYFKKEKSYKIQRVDPEWDGNELMTKKGLFFLTDVCEKIPFTPHQFRHQVRTNPNAEKDYGVWWDDELRHYIVRMEKFSKWIIDLWQNHQYGFE
ncbi:MAG: hypothetical protein H6510_12420 [Acidobacteria bacterium]|nr:hypothetical protein [Acidobacteriota bacterium]MCB9398610.1 hypothetical protein [Acidobacteriota bacterium]